MSGGLPSALVLAGGLGTRLPGVSATRPKPMADVRGRPFLEFLVEHLRREGVAEVILCVGYKAEIIVQHFGHDGGRFGVAFRFVREDEPLGTAGALRLALPFLGERALALNGDTFTDVDLRGLVARHVEARAAVTLAGVELEDAGRFGRIVAEGERVRELDEKPRAPGRGLVNAGVYVVERRVLEGIPRTGAVSFERTTLPGLLRAGEHVAVVRHHGHFVDIGVPEGLDAFRCALPMTT